MENTSKITYETLPTLPDFLSALLSTRAVTSVDLKTLLLNHMPKINGEITINNSSEFIQEISNHFDYFHVKKLSEELVVFEEYDRSIKIDDLKSQSNTYIQGIFNSFNALKPQLTNNKNELNIINSSINNIIANSQHFEKEEKLKELNNYIGTIRKNIKKISKGKNEAEKKPLEEFLAKIKNLEDTINNKAIVQLCIKNNIDFLSIYLGKNYNNNDITKFLTERNPRNPDIEKFMNSVYEFQKANSFIAPHVIDYIIEQNDPTKKIKESLFSKFSFSSIASNKTSLVIGVDGKNAIIEGTHKFFRDTDDLDYLKDHHNDLTKFSMEMLFGLDGDLIARLANFITDDLLIPEEKKGLWNGGMKGLIRGQFGIDESLVGTQEEKLLFIKNIQTLKVLLYFQLYNINQNKTQLTKDEIKNLFQSFIDMWEKSLTASIFKIYQLIEGNSTIRNLHKFAGIASWFSNDIGENLLLIKTLQEDSIQTEKKQLKEYYDQLKTEIGDIDEKITSINTRYNQEIINLDNKLKLIQNNPTDPKNIKDFLGQLTTTLLGDSPSLELIIKLSEIVKDEKIKTTENIKTELNKFFTEIKDKKQKEKESYINFVKKIGGEFFFKKEIKEEITKYLTRVRNTKTEDVIFLEDLQKDFLLSDLGKEKISRALNNNRVNVENINGLIFNLFSTFGSRTSPNILNIKNKIISLREEIKKIEVLNDKFIGYNAAFTNKKEYLENLSKTLGIDLKAQTIIGSINNNLSNGINEISRFKNLHNQKITIKGDGATLSANEMGTNNTTIINIETIKKHTPIHEQQKSKHGYIYAGVAGAIIASGALAITGIFMKKDISIENKVFASLIITAIVLVILIACVLSYKYELPNKVFNFNSSEKNKINPQTMHQA